MSANDDIADALVSHQIGIQRLSTATSNKALAVLSEVESQIVQQLERYDLTAISRQRRELLQAAVREIMREATTQLAVVAVGEIVEFAVYEVEYQLELFRRVLPIVVDTVTPSRNQIVAAVNSRPFQGRLMREWFSDYSATETARMRNAIRTGIVEGRTTSQMVRDIRGTRRLNFADGLLETTRRAAVTTVRTAVNHTANSARNLLYSQNTDLIKGVQWISTLDSRTSAVCRARDGRVYDVDKGPRPPAHPNCRSATVPVLKSWREMGIRLFDAPPGTRASLDGQVPENRTYAEWLRGRSQEEQDEILGTTKARLFRRGGLQLDRFVDRSGAEYTLDELRRREADAFERAGLSTVSGS